MIDIRKLFTRLALAVWESVSTSRVEDEVKETGQALAMGSQRRPRLRQVDQVDAERMGR